MYEKNGRFFFIVATNGDNNTALECCKKKKSIRIRNQVTTPQNDSNDIAVTTRPNSLKNSKNSKSCVEKYAFFCLTHWY